MMTSTSPTPLSQASPESLNEIFNKDPELVSDEDIAKVVAVLRADREKFIQNEKKPKAAPKAKADDKLTLEDLDL